MDNTQTGTAANTPAPMAAGDVVGLTVMGLFFALMVGLGVTFVRRKNASNLAQLTKALETQEAGEETPQLGQGEEPLKAPPTGSSAGQTVPAARSSQEADVRAAYSKGLEKTRTGFFGKLTALLSGTREIDERIVDELEPLLIQADVGVKTTQRLLDMVRERLSKKELTSAEKVKDALKQEILRIVSLDRPNIETMERKPTVIMVVGVNGAGKTTTIGKLSSRMAAAGKKVVLGAGDTFRAAAAEQLKVWGDRAGVITVEGKAESDPASVVFEACKQGKEMGADFVIGDTAGRLHTKVNLMEELKKVRRVIQKAVDGAPHEVLLVVDGTTGQNALVQAEQFNAAVELTGVVLTKLDGTAKGGIIIAICDQLKLPIRYVGVGEKLEDLRVFDAQAFVDSLFE